MGCWNETCGLTNLPIRYKDRVKLLIVVRKESRGNNVYYNDDAVPFLLPCEGDYNDYGSIENISISQNSIKVLESSEIFYFKNNNYEPYTFNIENFFKDVERGNLYIKHIGKYQKLGYLMYHKDAYDLVVKEMSNRIPYGQEDTMYNLQKNILYKKLKRKQEYIALQQDYLRFKDEETEAKFLSMFDCMDAIYGHSYLGHKMTDKYDSIITEETTNNYIESLTEAIMFFNALDFLRKSFYGQSGKGSQHYEMYIHKLLAEWVIEYYNQRQQEDLEECDEDTEPSDYKEDIFWFGN